MMHSLVIVIAALYGLSGADAITKIIVPLLGVLVGAAAGRFGKKKTVDPTIKSLLESNALLAAALEESQTRERKIQKGFQAREKEYQSKLDAGLEREEEWRRKFFRLDEMKTGSALIVGQIAATVSDPEASS